MIRFALAALAALALPLSARAHDLQATVTVSERVKVLAFYDDDPAQRADVTVTDASGAVVAFGKTDDRGLWEFARPAPGAYAVTVKEGGHIGRTSFRIEGEAAPAGAPPVEFADPRPNKALGLAIGTTALLGLSAGYWFLRRGRVVR